LVAARQELFQAAQKGAALDLEERTPDTSLRELRKGLLSQSMQSEMQLQSASQRSNRLQKGCGLLIVWIIGREIVPRVIPKIKLFLKRPNQQS
jgi:hypothetical protein